MKSTSILFTLLIVAAGAVVAAALPADGAVPPAATAAERGQLQLGITPDPGLLQSGSCEVAGEGRPAIDDTRPEPMVPGGCHFPCNGAGDPQCSDLCSQWGLDGYCKATPDCSNTMWVCQCTRPPL